MVDETNPWSAEGWNVTKQAQYFRAYGPDRAAARARDAGTTLGGKRPGGQPPLRPWAAPTYIVRREVIQLVPAPPSSLSTVGSVHPLIGVDMSLQILREYELTMSAVLGASMAAAVTLEKDLEPVAAAFGLDMASAVQLEKDFILTNSLGVDMAAALYREANPNASFALGVDMSTSLDLSQPAIFIAAANALGVDMTAVISRQFNATASNSVGVTMAASLLSLEQDFTASPALGINAAAALVLQRNLAASAALGVTMAAALSRTAQMTSSQALGPTLVAAIERSRLLAASAALGVTLTTSVTTSVPLSGLPTFVNVGASATAGAAASVVCPLPASRTNGNLLVATCMLSGSGVAQTVSSGWTIITQNNFTSMCTAYRYVTGSETACTFGGFGSSTALCQMAQFTGVRASVPIGATSLNDANSANMNIPAMTCISAGNSLVFCVMGKGGSFSAPPIPANYTNEATTANGTQGNRLCVENVVAAGGQCDAIALTTASNQWAIALIELRAN